MERKIVLLIHPLYRKRIKCLGLVLSFLMISGLAFAQPAKKSIWILFDTSDSLCVNMAGNSFRFYRYDKKFPYWDLGLEDAAAVKCDTIHHLPGTRHIVTRKELFVLLDKYPFNQATTGIPAKESKEDWYNKVYPISYVLVKKGCYYLRYRVVKVDIFD